MRPKRMTRLRFERQARGYTQLFVAQQARVANGRVSMLERGVVPPNETERAALSALFAVPPEDLFRVVDLGFGLECRNDRAGLADRLQVDATLAGDRLQVDGTLAAEWRKGDSALGSPEE